MKMKDNYEVILLSPLRSLITGFLSNVNLS
jgi:hypothetical protein